MNKVFKTLFLVIFCFATTLAYGEQTLALIKPNAVRNNHIGAIIERLESKHLKVIGLKMTKLDEKRAGEFYAAHKDRPFYPSLVKFMSSGPIVAMVLEGDDAVKNYRDVMGATDPKKAAKGTLRADFADSVTENAVHGSDSPDAAQSEIAFFFSPSEIFSR